MKKYAYVQYQRIPSPTAHTVLVTKTASAAASLGLASYLLIPRRTQPNDFNPSPIHDFYHLNDQLKIHHFWIPELNLLPQFIFKLLHRLSYLVPAWIFAIQAVIFCLINKINIVQTGSLEVLVIMRLVPSLVRPKLIYDLHIIHADRLNKVYEKIAKPVIDLWLLSAPGIKVRTDELSIDNEKVLVLPNGFNPSDYPAKVKLRKNKTFVFGYIGRFETMGIEKGIFTMLEVIALLKDKMPIKGLIVGGPEIYATQYQLRARELGIKKLVKFKPQVPVNEVGVIIADFDLATLLYPDTPHFRHTMSPMKAIEYMAGGVPVISSDLPSCRNLFKDFASYVDPTDVPAIVRQVKKIYTNYDKYLDRADEAKEYVQQFSWTNRQKIILEKFI